MNFLFRVCRASVRGLQRDWRAALCVVVVLTLGYGVAIATGRLVAPVFFPSSSIATPKTVVRIHGAKGSQTTRIAYPVFREYSAHAAAFSGLAAYIDWLPFDLSAGPQEGIERVTGAVVTGAFFDLLRVRPSIGRLLSTDDDSASAPPVVVLSHSFWTRRYGADTAILGKTVKVNGQPVEVVGVADKSFRGLSVERSPALWLPMALGGRVDPVLSKGGFFECAECRSFEVVGRLSESIGPRVAASQLKAIDATLSLADEQPTPTVVSLAAGVGAETQRIARLLLLLTTVLLLIASFNAAGLLMARAGRRRRESATRRSLGAGLPELVAQSMVEACLLSSSAAFLALFLAAWIGAELVPTALTGLPFAVEATPALADLEVLLGIGALALAWGAALGLLSALWLKDRELSKALHSGDGSLGTTRVRLRTALLVVQIALTVCLVVQGGLLIRTIRAVVSRDVGFDPSRVLVGSTDVSRQGYLGSASLRVLGSLLEDARRIPGAEAAALSTGTPFGGYQTAPMLVEAGLEPVTIDLAMVSPGYFRTMGIPLLVGRDVSDADTASAPTVAIVDERAARLYWPGQDPVGKTIPRIGTLQNVSVVGVARSVEKRTRTASPGTVHVALQQFYQAFPWQPRVQVAVRAAAHAGGGEAALAGAVRRLHPDVPLFEVRTLRDQQLLEFRKEDALRTLLSLLGVLAVILSAAGVYGIVAYAADARTREFGIRAALGAEPAELALQVCGHGARLAAVGILLGVLGAAGLGRAMSALLFGVAPFDALTYLVSGSLMLLVTLAASAGPAVRAMSPDLLTLLRSE